MQPESPTRLLVLASGNPDKLAEVRSILADRPVRIVPVTDLVPDWICEETGASIEENAVIKARAASAAAGLPAVADDTGLFVAALGGGPGVYSARYAGRDAGYEDNVRKLLRVLRWEEGDSRRAVFRTAAAYSDSSGLTLTASGEVAGTILTEPRGTGGFGYDPVFFAEALGCTYAECPAGSKNRASHRARAFEALMGLIIPAWKAASELQG
ncbi:MAG TPA: RdgB/HAM1 family non-canonical purine NTP pyrophosphatase [Candidatus Fermentibacter daniensis]|nr:RdgB/HAM1 family non-canonical purine NTP pyrophosphatase [Candidatus Fermentibacter daniensis]OQC69363.1 MAG: Non-canonical purine NTP pyrophosphatase [candidate division Hyd24-12 bacterium ADurb.Bin004]HOA04727.1 RdgB/HAM1 family non-canonical purine NTP pyrophosphatase [Candidatus Fermentibacter daniensis]HOG54906.1 RdgB/HAM1 family non-canonical purine NTP pyrophosphatase [Candidatus Fermentibacter daniensis]HPH39555.1 RdgB/HAM1 family non-canonical purine NTP pyrophosphatase [Candidatus